MLQYGHCTLDTVFDSKSLPPFFRVSWKKNAAIDKEDDPRDKYARCRKNTRFSLAKRTRVAKLNEHMFLQFWSKQ